MTTAMTREQKMVEKQLGCMAGFLQLFDRHQILTGKKFHAAKRLPPSSADVSDSEKSAAASPDVSKELLKSQTPKKPLATPSPERRPLQSPETELKSPKPVAAETPPKSPLPLPVFDFKEGTKSPWKFKETPRLSLDSRASYDAKGSLHRKEIRADRAILPSNPVVDAEESAGYDDDKQRARSSTSVIARLMGLEPISQPDPEPVKPAELRRSASESRATRDLFQNRFIDGGNFQLKQSNQSHSNLRNNVMRNNSESEISSSALSHRYEDPIGGISDSGQLKGVNRGIVSSSSAWKLPQHRKNLFEAAEVFPEPPKQAATVYAEIEKRLKMRGIDEAPKDLETLKQILEAWQLKGLLHSNRHSEQISHRNFVYDRSLSFDESPIVVMKPSRVYRRVDNDSPTSGRGGARRNTSTAGEAPPSASPRRERSVRSPTRSRSSNSPTRRPNSIAKPKALSVETQRRVNESTTESRRPVSSMHSPKVSPRRIGSDQTATNRPARNGKKPTAGIYQKEKITTVVTEDESSSISESTVSTSSQTDAERSKMEEYKEGGRSLLERCDKLLHSIAEMTATEQQQSSPVSVLDSSFYESASPSPVMKRSIHFTDNSADLVEETWSRLIFLKQPELDDASDDCDLIYISQIVRASHHLPEDSDIFSLLEKQQFLKGKDTSKISRLQRKLIFDTITEILDRNRQLPPWKKDSAATKAASIQQIWSEFQKIRERDSGGDLVEIIIGVLKKDLAGDAVNGWGECPVELSEVVLEIERMVFRDIVGEAIRDLAEVACERAVSVAPRRKLLF